MIDAWLKRWRRFLLKYILFRPGIIYAYSCIDPKTAQREWWAYVGKTRQTLAERHAQHMGTSPVRGKRIAQPWSDLYPEVRVVYELKCPEFVLDILEKWTIKINKPLYNYIYNTKNPRRIPKYQADQERYYRDLHRGRDRARLWL
jgi:hypothetical protein